MRKEIIMFDKWNRDLRKKMKDDERESRDNLSGVDEETFSKLQHNMQVEKDVLKKVYLSLADLEQADLEDYKDIERKYGRSD